MTATTIVDLSNNNSGNEDFGAARRGGVGAMWHKVSEGDWFADKFYAGRSAAARGAGVDDGGYHMLRHDADIARQVQWFLAHLDRGHKLRAMIDAEHHYSGGKVIAGSAPTVDDILRFGDGLHHALGYVPVLYTYESFLNHELAGDRRLQQFPLDIADYGAVPATPWAWAAWQYTDAAHLPGINGAVDAHHCPDLTPLLVPGQQPTPQPIVRRPHGMRYFFKITGAPADKVSPDTLWLGDGFQGRPMSGDNDMAEPKRIAFIAIAEGYPANALDPAHPGLVPWSEASRMHLVGVS